VLRLKPWETKVEELLLVFRVASSGVLLPEKRVLARFVRAFPTPLESVVSAPPLIGVYNSVKVSSLAFGTATNSKILLKTLIIPARV